MHPQTVLRFRRRESPRWQEQGRCRVFPIPLNFIVIIIENMPFFRSGSLTSEEAWSLTAYILRMNDRESQTGFTLNEIQRRGDFRPSQSHAARKPNPRRVDFDRGVDSCGGRGEHPTPNKSARLANQTSSTTCIRPAFQRRNPVFDTHWARAERRSFSRSFCSSQVCWRCITTSPHQRRRRSPFETITTLVPFGSLIRNLHFWSAQFLVIVMSIHLLRVTLTGAYAPPRRFNHVLGVALLAFILLLDFTGYVLRWDEGIHWALVVGANMLKTIPWIGEGLYQFVIGGSEPGDSTLIRFYAWHIFGLTLGAVILIVWHAFRVRRDGGIAVPPPTERKEKERISRFDLVRREVLAMTITAVILIALFPAHPRADRPTHFRRQHDDGNSHAPWFFLWIQHLLKFGDPFVMGILVPVLVVIALGAMPYILPNAKSEELGKWFPRGNRIAQVLAVLIMFLILVLTVLGAIPKLKL